MSELAKKRCIPCQGDIPALEGQELDAFAAEVPRWAVANGHHLDRELTFPDFRQALDFTNQIGELAEHEGHHPDIYLAWGKVGIKIWTHKVDGLTESDFILAAKIDQL